MTLLEYSVVGQSFIWIRGPKLQYSICDLSAEGRGIIPFLGLLALLLLVQPRVLLALVCFQSSLWTLATELPLNLSVPVALQKALPSCGQGILAFVLVEFHQAPVSSPIPTV